MAQLPPDERRTNVPIGVLSPDFFGNSDWRNQFLLDTIPGCLTGSAMFQVIKRGIAKSHIHTTLQVPSVSSPDYIHTGRRSEGATLISGSHLEGAKTLSMRGQVLSVLGSLICPMP